MEENNKKGPGVFYAVVGVATLLVAIIGATFAYFSASVNSTGADIEGATNDVAADLSLTVTRVDLGGTATSDDLVPATITSDSTTGLNLATATNKCEKDGYTGCHVYEITATSSQTIASADILLTLSNTATNTGDWKYLVYQGSSATQASAITTDKASFPASNVDIHDGGFTLANNANSASVTYYLMIFIEESNAKQNDTTATAESTTTTNATGSYEGTVTLQAAGNHVTANLSA